jgi:predicted porin
VEKTPGPDRDEQQFYQGALNFTFGNFAVGGVFEYYKNGGPAFVGTTDDADNNVWVAGGGISYTMDAWTVGAQYSHQDADNDSPDSGVTQDRVVLTGNYAMGPGINIDGELGYTWIDTDPETDTPADDDYQALEIGIGTNITF